VNLLAYSPRILRAFAVGSAVVAGTTAALVTGATAQQQDFSKITVDTVHVRGGIYMLAAEGGSNMTVQVGPEGVLVVDTHFAPMAPKFLEAIRKVAGDAPIRYVVNTHSHGDHWGGNEAIAKAGRFRAGGNVVGDIGGAATSAANIVAHENAMNRMSAPVAGQPAPSFAALPTVTFFNNRRDMLFNDEAVQMIHQPSAHTDGDIVVFFRRTDVVSTGDLFTTVMYPFIDAANGGSTNGYIKALNGIIDITVPSNVNEGGTLVIPGHGRLSDEQDVIEYRDMLTIVRDRIEAYVKRGMTLEQVRAKKPTLDWDARYGIDAPFWSTDRFIEQIYKDMVALHPPPAPPTRNQRNRNQPSGSAK
jgi:glyoxylase-like metal-dependent hydrolase (beta-lactamase superfamily II)